MGVARARVCAALAALCALHGAAQGDMYDVVQAHRAPPAACPSGCQDWGSAEVAVQALWVDRAAMVKAGSACAQTGRYPRDGAWCMCAQGGQVRVWDGAPSPQPLRLGPRLPGPDSSFRLPVVGGSDHLPRPCTPGARLDGQRQWPV